MSWSFNVINAALSFTVRAVSKPAQYVTINADNLTPIAGHSVTINYVVDPADTTDKLTWIIVKGDDIATMGGNVLFVYADAPFIRGNGACQDLAYNFRHESGKTGNEVAVYNYEDGTISFNMTGKVTVTVSYASGSKVEATTSYTFNINNGYNTYTFQDLHLLPEAKGYNGQPVNIVVLEKPVGATCTVAGCYCGNKSYEYGYDLVPAIALKDHKDQTICQVMRGREEGVVNGMVSNRIVASNSNLHLNGNNHVINGIYRYCR